MRSNPILLVGPAASGKTHIAMAIMNLQLVNAVIVDSLDREKLSRHCKNDSVKLIIVEGVPCSNYLNAIYSEMRKKSKAAFVFTSQMEMDSTDVHSAFVIINCINKF